MGAARVGPREASCGLGSEEVKEGGREGSGEETSWLDQSVLTAQLVTELVHRLEAWIAKLHAGLSRVQWVLSV